ncbi:hypothetical protein GF342_02895 [Candidatus Woesearchaeota archaeon]|nr:hypothetical protein [Candidatus Woesearchaeota archaeon]
MIQHLVFELNGDSLTELKSYAKKFDKKIKSFRATATGNPYDFYYIELPGPRGICHIDISRAEELKE